MVAKNGVSRKHHYVPQFYLRAFSSDIKRRKVAAIQKHGTRAVWAERHIKSIGYETDFYVREENGQIISSETIINARIETPLSSSSTWRKIMENRVCDLDCSDRFILYLLVRHLEARTPHNRQIARELDELAIDPESSTTFTDEEREMYAQLRAIPGLHDEIADRKASDIDWTLDESASAAVAVWRFRIPIYTSTTPVLVAKAPPDPRLRSQQLHHLTPHCYILPLSPYACVVLSIGDFDGVFSNTEVPDEVAIGLRRHFVGHFGYFPDVQHLICDANSVIAHMNWAGYSVCERQPRRMVFERRPNIPVHVGPRTGAR